MPAGFRNYVEAVRPCIDQAFATRLRELLDGIATNDGAALRTTLQGGKKARGCLVCLVSDAFGGDLESALPRAVAVELIQTATLIHDDFVDQDRVRRGAPAVWTLAGARRAVLLGDVIFASAIRMMSELSRVDGLVVSDAIAQIARGACQEPIEPGMLMHEIEAQRVNRDLYEKIIYLKTGVLFGAACRLGAIAAGADETLQMRLFRYGLRIGEAYQIADDLVDLKQQIGAEAVRPDRMAALAPALFHFLEDAGPLIAMALGGESSEAGRALPERASMIVRSMESEIEQKIVCAKLEIHGGCPVKEYAGLLEEAPRELTRMMISPHDAS